MKPHHVWNKDATIIFCEMGSQKPRPLPADLPAAGPAHHSDAQRFLPSGADQRDDGVCIYGVSSERPTTISRFLPKVYMSRLFMELLPLTSCVTSGRSLHLSGSWFSDPQNGDVNGTHLRGLLWGRCEIMCRKSLNSICRYTAGRKYLLIVIVLF